MNASKNVVFSVYLSATNLVAEREHVTLTPSNPVTERHGGDCTATNLVEECHHDECVKNDGEMLIGRRFVTRATTALNVEKIFA